MDATSGTPKGKSIAHKHLEAGEVAFLLFDVEAGGDLCWIIQLSCQIFRIALPATTTSTPKMITTDEDPFNEDEKPQEGAIWSQYVINVNGITHSDPQIQGANTIEDLWGSFCMFVDQWVCDNEVAILVIYNGETCILKWLWKLTISPNLSKSMTPKCKFFIDLLKITKHYKSCFFNLSKTKLESSNLQSIYKYVMGQDLVGAHSSIADCMMQTTIVGSDLFFSFINKTNPFIQSMKNLQAWTKWDAKKTWTSKTRTLPMGWAWWQWWLFNLRFQLECFILVPWRRTQVWTI